MNRKPDGKLIGDVDPAAVQQLAGAYTPVPGGVGPLTIAMLMSNTVHAAEAPMLRPACSPPVGLQIVGQAILPAAGFPAGL